jgi:hypothetical protein
MALRIPALRRSSRRLVSAVIFAIALGTLLSSHLFVGDIREVFDSSSPDSTGASSTSDLFGKKNMHQHSPLIYDETGLVRGWDTMPAETESEDSLSGRGKVLSKHPIEELIAAGLKQWTTLLGRSVNWVRQLCLADLPGNPELLVKPSRSINADMGDHRQRASTSGLTIVRGTE